MLDILKRLVKDEEGQGLVEYALILGLVSLVVVVGLQLIGVELWAGEGSDSLFSNILNRLRALP